MRWKENALQELLERGRAGERWGSIGARFYPDRPNADQLASNAFSRFASPVDKAMRRQVIAERRDSPKPPRRHRAASAVRPEPPLRPERVDPWAGQGACFA